ncbi:hypothetical protein CLF_103999, partial [Clonorchis sinensis]
MRLTEVNFTKKSQYCYPFAFYGNSAKFLSFNCSVILLTPFLVYGHSKSSILLIYFHFVFDEDRFHTGSSNSVEQALGVQITLLKRQHHQLFRLDDSDASSTSCGTSGNTLILHVTHPDFKPQRGQVYVLLMSETQQNAKSMTREILLKLSVLSTLRYRFASITFGMYYDNVARGRVPVEYDHHKQEIQLGSTGKKIPLKISSLANSNVEKLSPVRRYVTHKFGCFILNAADSTRRPFAAQQKDEKASCVRIKQVDHTAILVEFSSHLVILFTRSYTGLTDVRYSPSFQPDCSKPIWELDKSEDNFHSFYPSSYDHAVSKIVTMDRVTKTVCVYSIDYLQTYRMKRLQCYVARSQTLKLQVFLSDGNVCRPYLDRHTEQNVSHSYRWMIYSRKCGTGTSVLTDFNVATWFSIRKLMHKARSAGCTLLTSWSDSSCWCDTPSSPGKARSSDYCRLAKNTMNSHPRFHPGRLGQPHSLLAVGRLERIPRMFMSMTQTHNAAKLYERHIRIRLLNQNGRDPELTHRKVAIEYRRLITLTADATTFPALILTRCANNQTTKGSCNRFTGTTHPTSTSIGKPETSRSLRDTAAIQSVTSDTGSLLTSIRFDEPCQQLCMQSSPYSPRQQRGSSRIHTTAVAGMSEGAEKVDVDDHPRWTSGRTLRHERIGSRIPGVTRNINLRITVLQRSHVASNSGLLQHTSEVGGTVRANQSEESDSRINTQNRGFRPSFPGQTCSHLSAYSVHMKEAMTLQRVEFKHRETHSIIHGSKAGSYFRSTSSDTLNKGYVSLALVGIFKKRSDIGCIECPKVHASDKGEGFNGEEQSAEPCSNKEYHILLKAMMITSQIRGITQALLDVSPDEFPNQSKPQRCTEAFDGSRSKIPQPFANYVKKSPIAASGLPSDKAEKFVSDGGFFCDTNHALYEHARDTPIRSTCCLVIYIDGALDTPLEGVTYSAIAVIWLVIDKKLPSHVNPSLRQRERWSGVWYRDGQHATRGVVLRCLCGLHRCPINYPDIIIIMDSITSVFNTHTSLPYNHDLHASLTAKERIK